MSYLSSNIVLSKEKTMTARILMEGRRYGNWVVQTYDGRNFKGQPIYTCRCDCGTVRGVVAQSLRQGKSKSCGCLKGAAIAKAHTTHGQSKWGATRTYKTWRAMHRRCVNKTPRVYMYYGALGIKVCERWHSFENFFADMGHIPEGMSLDRIDPYKGYSPDNCRWATPLMQRLNQRRYVG